MNLWILKSLLILNSHYPFKEDKIEKYQNKKLKKIMKRAYEIPFYHKKFEEVGLTPDDFNCSADLAKFPLCTKQELREWLEEEIAKNPSKYENYTKCHTSGSTGIPLEMYYRPREIAVNTANWIRVCSVQGYRAVTQSCMGIRGEYRIPKKGDSIVQRLGILRRYVASYLLSGEELLEMFIEKKPDLVYGNKSKLVQMALAVQEKEKEIPKPRWYSPASEQMDEGSAELLKNVFGDGMFVSYGCEEMGTCAFTLQGDWEKYVVSRDTHVVNLVNEEGKLADKGRMVLTSLYQYEFPVINYDIGDYAEAQKCGGGNACLVNLHGRDNDYFGFDDGSSVSWQLFYDALSERKELAQARFIQEDYHNIKIEAVLRKEYKIKEKEVMQQFVADIQEGLKRPNVSVHYKIFDVLPVDKNGKIRIMTSCVDK